MKYYDYFKGIRLCSISQNKFNYYILLKNSTKTINECLKQKNMKVCGILDDLNQIVCLYEDYSCPINDIIFNENKTYSININKTKINYENIKINDNLYIHYTNKNYNKKIISNFNISFNKPCSHFYSKPQRNNIFIAYDFIYCDKNIDSLFQRIYSQNATQFMKENDLYYSFSQLDPTKFNNYNITLYSSFYFGFYKKCILQYNFNQYPFYNYFSNYYTFKKQNELFEASLIILSLLMLCNPFYSGHYTAFIYFIVHGITFIISFILLIYSRITIKKLYSPFEC